MSASEISASVYPYGSRIVIYNNFDESVFGIDGVGKMIITIANKSLMISDAL